MAIWYILWSSGILPPVLVYCAKKNLATLVVGRKKERIFLCLNEDFFCLNEKKRFFVFEHVRKQFGYACLLTRRKHCVYTDCRKMCAAAVFSGKARLCRSKKRCQLLHVFIRFN
jgi:hypothetical protein